MKILILNWKDIKNPDVGGAEVIVYELAKRLGQKGHQITWFSRKFKGCRQEEDVEGIHIVRYGNTLTTYLYAPFYYWTHEKPDLVIDMSNTICWQTPLWAFRSKRIAYLNQLGQEVFYYEYSLLTALLGYIFERVQYLSYKSTNFLVYSESTREDLVKIGITRRNIKVFTIGVDHSRYIPGRKSKQPLFICVSRLVRMKRTSLVIQAMDIVRKAFPEAKLKVMGYGYERKALEILRNKLRLNKNVIFQDEDILFFEKNAKDQKVRLMQEAWALIFPSVKEGWGMTVTECAACGTPTIASKVTGLKDSVKDGQTGILVSKNPTPNEIASEMIRLIENDKLRERLSKEAIKYSKKFTWEKSFEVFSKELI